MSNTEVLSEGDLMTENVNIDDMDNLTAGNLPHTVEQSTQIVDLTRKARKRKFAQSGSSLHDSQEPFEERQVDMPIYRNNITGDYTTEISQVSKEYLALMLLNANKAIKLQHKQIKKKSAESDSDAEIIAQVKQKSQVEYQKLKSSQRYIDNHAQAKLQIEQLEMQKRTRIANIAIDNDNLQYMQQLESQTAEQTSILNFEYGRQGPMQYIGDWVRDSHIVKWKFHLSIVAATNMTDNIEIHDLTKSTSNNANTLTSTSGSVTTHNVTNTFERRTIPDLNTMSVEQVNATWNAIRTAEQNGQTINRESYFSPEIVTTIGLIFVLSHKAFCKKDRDAIPTKDFFEQVMKSMKKPRLFVTEVKEFKWPDLNCESDLLQAFARITKIWQLHGFDTETN